jgi:hypothetical protein
MERQLNSEEFFDEMWMKIPEELISNKYIDENSDMWRDIVFKFYEHYAEDRITVNLAAKIIADTFYMLFKYKPLLCNVVDDYLVNSLDEE